MNTPHKKKIDRLIRRIGARRGKQRERAVAEIETLGIDSLESILQL